MSSSNLRNTLGLYESICQAGNRCFGCDEASLLGTMSELQGKEETVQLHSLILEAILEMRVQGISNKTHHTLPFPAGQEPLSTASRTKLNHLTVIRLLSNPVHQIKNK